MKVGIGLPNALPDVSGADQTERIEARTRGFFRGRTTDGVTCHGPRRAGKPGLMSGRGPADADVVVFWWQGCPSWQRALSMVREQMEKQGLSPDALEVIEIRNEADAERFGFPGSPTIRVGGEDIQPPDPERPVGLTCRVYRRRDGRISPLPDPEDLREAFATIRG